MKDGEIVDIKVSHPESFSSQMLDYAKQYSFLPSYN
jgi:dipeptidyl-peptidase-3